MGRSRSNSLSHKKSRRRSSSRSKHSKKSRHRTPEKKSSKYRRRSQSSSDSSADRYKSSSKHKIKRTKKGDSRSPSSHRSRNRRRSSSSSNSSSRSSNSSSNSSSKLHRNKPSSSYVDKIRAMRTPTPPQSKTNFEASVEFLDQRPVLDAIDEINANEFRPKTFNSSTNTKAEKSDSDVKVKNEVKLNQTNINDDPLFHQKVINVYISSILLITIGFDFV